MNSISTKAIVLSRTNFGESDRIITVVTSTGSKIALMGKGVRKLKSRLAGGIELFCVCDISYIEGRSRIGTLTSARVEKQYKNITSNIDRTMFGYEVLKLINRATEDEELTDYFTFLQQTLAVLNDSSLSLDLVKSWAMYQLLNLSGHTPNLITDDMDKKITEGKKYSYSFQKSAFAEDRQGEIDSRAIKLLRVIETGKSPTALASIGGTANIYAGLVNLLTRMVKYSL